MQSRAQAEMGHGSGDDLVIFTCWAAIIQLGDCVDFGMVIAYEDYKIIHDTCGKFHQQMVLRYVR